MVSQDYRQLSRQRAERARELAQHYPSASQVLDFYALVAEFQANIFDKIDGLQSLAHFGDRLRKLVDDHGTDLLRQTAGEFQNAELAQAIVNYQQHAQSPNRPEDFFVRVLLQLYLAGRFQAIPIDSDSGSRCPRCDFLPQVGALTKLEHGQALHLICSMCGGHWPYPRGTCPSCQQQDDRNLVFYSAEQLPHIQAQACQNCRSYIHLIDIEKEPQAMPEVDELCALPLDIWAHQNAYRKLQPNLAGI